MSSSATSCGIADSELTRAVPVDYIGGGQAPLYDRADFRTRALWTARTGLGLVWRLRRELRAEGLPVHRGRPLPLDLLPRLLITPDAHLITLRDGFVGYVLPSKVYGCVQSGRGVLYVGSPDSSVRSPLGRGRPPPGICKIRLITSDQSWILSLILQIPGGGLPRPRGDRTLESGLPT